MTPTPNTVQQATLLAHQGFRLVPTNGKVATTDGFGAENPTFTCGPEWFANPGTKVGILCGPCPALGSDWLLCVDIDGENWDEVPELRAFVDLLPLHTLESHGGRHIFLRVPATRALELEQWPNVFRTKTRTGCAIDLKWAGGYACEAWDWEASTDTTALAAAIAPLPEAALAMLLEARAARTTSAAGTPPALPAPDRGDDFLRAQGFDPELVREDAKKWLLSPAAPMPDAVGDGGTAMLLAVGALMVGFGLDDETVFDLTAEVYCPRAWPGDAPDETQIAHKIDQIDINGSERFTVPLQLAVVARETRRGAALILAPVSIPELPASVPPTPDRDPTQLLATLEYRLSRTAKGELKNSVHNTLLVLSLHPLWRGLFGYDEFTHDVVFLRDPIGVLELNQVHAGDIFNEDVHPTPIRSWFGRGFHEPSTAEMIAAVHTAAKERRFHAVRRYFDGVRGTWDGVDRNLVDYLGAEPTPYHRAVCAKWLRSAVARAMVPGAKADTMLILEGRQGLRKSTALRCLCPDVRWFFEAASRDVGSKDFMQDMRGKWLCEIPEVDQLIQSRDESELKALLSRVSDNYRASYARRTQDFLRQLVFGGTTNKGGYLRDETGNRRYWAVACGVIGPILDGAICDDRDQLWAQALAEYEAGEVWHLTSEEDVLATQEQAARLETDVWTDSVQAWLEVRGDEPFTLVEVLGSLSGAKPVADLDQRDMNRMAKLLRHLGYEARRQRCGGRPTKLWVRS